LRGDFEDGAPQVLDQLVETAHREVLVVGMGTAERASLAGPMGPTP
jgi:hypothetical protein